MSVRLSVLAIPLEFVEYLHPLNAEDIVEEVWCLKYYVFYGFCCWNRETGVKSS